MAQSVGKGFRTLPKIGSNCKRQPYFSVFPHPPVSSHSRCCECAIDRYWRNLMNSRDSLADHAGLFCIVCSIASCQNDHYQIPDDEILAATVFKRGVRK